MRRALLQGLVACYAALAVGTELLHALHALSRGPMAAVFGVAAAAGLALAWRGRGRLVWPKDRLEQLCLAGVASVALPVGLLAFVSRPSVVDAMAYHMPRVVFWAQARSLHPFPTDFPQQIALQPFNEYLTLYAYVLAGGSDRWVNVPQFAAFLACVIAASLIVKRLGGGRPAQALAALFAATMPGAVLQGSGSKNDLTATATLLAAAYFLLCYRESRRWADLAAAGLALALSVLTKGTAYMFAPPLLAAVGIARPWWRTIVVAGGCVVALNAPYWARTTRISGTPLGLTSVYSNGEHRFGNDRMDAGVVFSNVARNAALHFTSVPGVVRVTRWAHRVLGLDPDDPATTWTGTLFRHMDGYCTMKETCAPSPWHAFLLLAALPFAVRRGGRTAWYAAGLAGMFLLFCAALRWQPWHARMHVTILMAGSALIGLLAERRRWALALAAGLTLAAQPYIYRGHDRPLLGRASILLEDRDSQYFSDNRDQEEDYRRAAAAVVESGCTEIGIENSYDATEPPPRRPPLEYPVMAITRAARPEARFIHVGVDDPSARFAENQAFARPCVVVCLACGGDAAKSAQLAEFGAARYFGKVAVFGGRGSE